ncbi:MAG: short-chain dehydrogenase [Salinisphaeraceae bacterium]|nr:short-chain dehydrogenase [Salinisphaeraceae bacterium]
MTDQKDKVLLITGASSGIGQATARAAGGAGWRVALAARRREPLDGLVDELGGASRAIALVCDVQDEAAQKAMVADALDHFGQLDAVFANAGRGGEPGGFAGASAEVWKDMLLTNVLGVAITVQASLEALKASGGQLLITGSVAGRRTLAGSMYSATKWAVSAIGYNLREELRGSGVRVTLIEPGMVDTPFFDEPKPDALRPEDVADCVLFALQRPQNVDVSELLVLPQAR